jgi:fucose 4-O-acetylase-like acetyltransferase
VTKSATSGSKAGRYDWVDYAKGIAIFLVVYRHSYLGLKLSGIDTADYMYLEYGNIMFFSFRMPLFFIVSGIFVSSSLVKRGLGPFLGQKVKTILYPYFLWGTLQITFQLILAPYVNSSSRSGADYLNLLWNPHGVDQFWYLYALFNVTLLYALLRSLLHLKPVAQLFLGFILYYLSFYSSQQGWKLEFLQDVLHYYVFFAIGDVTASFFRNEKNMAFLGSFRLFWLILPFFIFAQVYFLLTNIKHDPEDYRYVETYEPTLFFLVVLSGCAFMLSISFLLHRFKSATWLRIIGFHSLYIYVSHVFITSGIRVLFTRVLGIHNLPLMLALSIGLGILLPILFYRFCQARGWYFFFSLDKERIKLKPRAGKVVAE